VFDGWCWGFCVGTGGAGPGLEPEGGGGIEISIRRKITCRVRRGAGKKKKGVKKGTQEVQELTKDKS